MDDFVEDGMVIDKAYEGWVMQPLLVGYFWNRLRAAYNIFLV